jgi:DNA modification methylase
MDIKQHNINDLVFAEYNPRQLTKDQYKNLKDSIKRFGLVDPIIINTNKDRENIVIGGHQRLKIAKDLNIDKIPCVELDLTIDQEKELNVRLNKNTGEWDWDALGNYFDVESLIDWGFTNEELQFETPDVVGLTDEDEIPEKVTPRTKLCDIWILGSHKLLCGDATIKEDVERLLDGKKADMVFTDPPYGINEKGDRTARKTGLAKNHNFKDFIDDSIDYAVKSYSLLDTYDIPIQIWFGANYYCHFLPMSNNWLVWDKRVEDKMSDNQSDCELAWVKTNKSSVRIFRHLWRGFNKDSERNQPRVHPTQKPIALAEWCFENYGKPKTVLDLFLGSGSTLIACEKTNRKCYGMELDPAYCDVIVQRWEDYTGKKAILMESANA